MGLHSIITVYLVFEYRLFAVFISGLIAEGGSANGIGKILPFWLSNGTPLLNL